MAQYSQVHHNVAELTSAEIVKPLPEDPVKEAAALLRQEDELREKIQRQEQALQEQMRFEQKQQTEMQELEQARAEFAQLQQSRRRAAMQASLPENSPYFIAAKTYKVIPFFVVIAGRVNCCSTIRSKGASPLVVPYQ